CELEHSLLLRSTYLQETRIVEEISRGGILFVPVVDDGLPEQHVCPIPAVALLFRQLVDLFAPCQRGLLLALNVLVAERRLRLRLDNVDGGGSADEKVR